MVPNIDPAVVSTIVGAVVYRPDGATLNDIIEGFPEAPDRTTVMRWVAALVAADILELLPDGVHYVTMAAAAEYWPPRQSSAAAASAPTASSADTAPIPASSSAAPSALPPTAAAGSSGTSAPSEPPLSGSSSQKAVPNPAASSAGSSAVSPTSATGSSAASTANGAASSAVPAANPNADSASSSAASSSPNGSQPGESSHSSSVAPAAQPYPAPVATPYQALFEDAIVPIVGYTKGRSPALIILQNISQGLPNPADRLPFVQYGLGRLEHLTLGDALRHTLQPSQYELWRRNYFPTSPAVGSSPASSAAPSSTAPASTAASSADRPTEAPRSSAQSSAQSSAPAGSKKRKSSPPTGAEDSDSAGNEVADALASMLKPAIDAGGHPPKRASSSSPSGLPSALSKLIAASLSSSSGGVGKATSATAIVSTILALVFAVLQYMRFQPWLVVTALAVVGAGIAFVVWRSRRTMAPAQSEPQADDPADDDGTTPRTMPRTKVYLLITAIGMTVVAIAGTIWYLRASPKPSKADVSVYLTNSLAPLPVRVAAIDLTFLRTGSAGCTVKYDAQIVATAPLYQRINTAEYLRTQSAADMSAIDAASALLVADQRPGTKDQGLLSSRLATAGAGPAPTPALRDLVLVKVQTVPGKSAHISGTPEAFWNDGAWSFSNDDVRIDPKQLGGEPKPANALAVDQSTDIGRLKSLIAEHAAYAAKVQAAATALAADLAREQAQKAAELALGRTVEPSNGRTAGSVEATTAQRAADLEQARQQKLIALNQLLQRGTFLSGMVVAVPKPDSFPVLLEVTDCSATTHQITLVLRNTSGWYNTRSGKGTWSIDADNEVCTAKVWFANDERIPGAGRPLDDTGSWYLTVRVRLDGTIAAEPRGWELQRVAADAVAAAKAEFGFGAGRTVEPSNGRTAPGAVAAGRGDQRPGTKDEGPGGAGAPSRAAAGQSVGTPITGATAARSIGVTASDQPIDRSTALPSAGSTSAGSTSVTPFDRSTVTPSSDRPLDRSTVTPTASADAALASALNDLSLIAGTRTGAYALVGGTWLRLPTNSAKAVQGVAQKLTGALQNLGSVEDRLAGKSSDTSTAEIAEIRFDGIEPVPAVPTKDVVIVYVGALAPFTAADVARHPELKDYPVMELASEKTLSKSVRYASLYRVASGFLGFGASRVANATIDQSTAANLTILRCPTLARGRYAVACGNNSYEIAVE